MFRMQRREFPERSIRSKGMSMPWGDVMSLMKGDTLASSKDLGNTDKLEFSVRHIPHIPELHGDHGAVCKRMRTAAIAMPSTVSVAPSTVTTSSELTGLREMNSSLRRLEPVRWKRDRRPCLGVGALGLTGP
jgi:hypothetical protein